MPSLTLGVTPRAGLCALALGIVSALAFPPVGLWPLALAGVAGFLWLLRDEEAENALNLGLVYGFAYGLGTLYWLAWLFGFLVLAFVGLFALYFGVLALLIAKTKGSSPFLRAVLAGVFVVAIEWLRGDAWYLRFPWYTVPHALAQEPAWIASARWLGSCGLSFLVWFLAGLGAFGRPWAWSAFLLLPLASLLLPTPAPPDRRALLLQTEALDGVEDLIATLAEVGQPRPAGIDLAVLPEYAYFTPYQTALASQKGPAVLARYLQCPVVFGAVDGDYTTPDFHNVAVVLGADGLPLGLFVKQRPVPLMRDGLPGSDRPIFPVEHGSLGVALCYDFDAPAVAGSLTWAGATVLVAPNYDAMTWSEIQHVHHELLFRLRAVENDRWLVRAASSGRSEAIDPTGVPSVAGLDIGAVGTVVVAFGQRDTRPLGSVTHWFGPGALGVTLLLGAVCFLGRLWRSRRASFAAEGKSSPPCFGS